MDKAWEETKKALEQGFASGKPSISAKTEEDCRMLHSSKWSQSFAQFALERWEAHFAQLVPSIASLCKQGSEKTAMGMFRLSLEVIDGSIPLLRHIVSLVCTSERGAEMERTAKIVVKSMLFVPEWNFQPFMMQVFESFFAPFCEKGQLTLQEELKSFCEALSKLQWLDELGPQIEEMIVTRLLEKVETACEGNSEERVLEPLTEWVKQVVHSWLSVLVRYESHWELDEWTSRMLFRLYEGVGEARSRQLFDLIVEYPDSHPALLDLQICLNKCPLRDRLIRTLRNDLQKRLLQPGASTADIILQYVSTIRVLRLLDPTSVMLEAVCAPVREYLRNREDTIRRIVQNLVEGSTDLASELTTAPHPPIIEDFSDHEGTEDETAWEPDPVDADPSLSARWLRTADIVSLLVGIYGSTDMFVTEFRSLLAYRLLRCEYDTEHDVRNVELLKLRFGETELRNCEVMLTDVADSKRTNQRVAESLSSFPMQVLMISEHFWPSLKENPGKGLHPTLQKVLDDYDKAYHKLKAPRRLLWKTMEGFVDLDLEWGDGKTLQVTTSPVGASILLLFGEQSRWTVQQVVASTGFPEDLVTRQLKSWCSQGVLQWKGESVCVAEGDDEGDVVEEEGEEEGGSSATAARLAEDLALYERFVVGMLAVHELPVERIHNMLKMYAGSVGSGIELPELQTLLTKMVRDGVLECRGGMYKKVLARRRK